MTARTKALFFCFSLFAAAFPSTAKATYRNGVLDIKVLKVEVSKGVNVSIK